MRRRVAQVYHSNREVAPLALDYHAAKNVREVFYGKPMRAQTPRPFGWPRYWMDIGRCNAQLYESDKWIDNQDEWELYKHIAEGPQRLYVNPSNTNITNGHGRPFQWVKVRKVPARGSTQMGVIAYMPIEIEPPMPKYVADLADNRGVQIHPSDGELYEIHIPNSVLAGGVHPKTQQIFLCVYSPEGFHLLITGDELHISRHGIGG